MTTETIGYEEKGFEVSRSDAHDQGKKSRCIVISSVLLSKENVDQDLLNNETKGCESTRHFLLRIISSHQKLQGLHLNDMRKHDIRFEGLIK